MLVYKYRAQDENLLRLLRERKLWCSSHDQLNDPHEARFAITPSLKKEDLEQYVQEQVSGDSPPPVGFVDSLLEHHESLIPYVEERLSEHLNTFGICCLSKTCTSDLMWTHYADNHRGVCLEFDLGVLASKGWVHNVVYG